MTRGRGPSRSARAAVTLLEMLVVVAVLAAALGVVAAGWRGPSVEQRLRMTADALVAAAATARAQAMASGAPQMLRVPDDAIIDGPPIWFTADGGAVGGPLILRNDGRALRLEAHWLTGALTAAAHP